MLRNSRLRWRNEKDETGLFKTFRDRKRQKETERDTSRRLKNKNQTQNTKRKKKNKKIHGAKEESIRRIFKNILASDPQGLWFLF